MTISCRFTMSGILMLCGACAVGPSTHVAPAAYPIVVRGDSLTTSTTRHFLDSLNRAREADRPDLTPTTLWRPLPLNPVSNRDVAWLDILRDSDLVALVNTSIANNRDLQIAEARVREFRAERGVARSDLLPQLSASAVGGRYKIFQPNGPNAAYNSVSALGELAWELDFWGRLRRQTQAANFDLQGRQEDARAITLTLISDVATAYLELRELDEDVHISEQTLSSRQEVLALAQQRFQRGVISQLDAQQFESDVAEAAVRVADFARQRSEKEHQLSLLLGTHPAIIPRGLPLEASVQSVTVPDSLPGGLIVRRPDVLRAQRDFQAALARIGLAMTSRLPAVSITGQYGVQRPMLQGLFTPRGEIYTLQAGITVPLFSGGKLRNEERAARARADEARGAYEQTVLTALRESSDALVGVRLGRDQLAAQTTQVQALEKAFTLAQQRYSSGISSYLEVLDAQRSLFTSRLNLVQTQRRYLAATVQLYKALGGEWGTGRPLH